MFSRVGLVEALDLRNGELTLRSRRRLEVGQLTQVRVQIPPGTGKVVTVPIKITTEKDQGSAGFVYRAELQTELDGLEFRGDDPILRERPRHEVAIRARAKELPQFRAMVSDFSRTGAQLELSGPVKRGLKFQLHLDLEGFRLATVAIAAEVVRVSSKDGHHQCGVHFLPGGADEDRLLADLAEFVARRASSDLDQLLAQAKMLEPETGIYREKAPPKATASTTESATPAPSPGGKCLLLPVLARVDGYTRNLSSGSLFVRFQTADAVVHTLEFPACELLRDLHTSQCAEVARLSSSSQSDWLQAQSARLGPGIWKHYALVAADGEVLLELISRPCRA